MYGARHAFCLCINYTLHFSGLKRVNGEGEYCLCWSEEQLTDRRLPQAAMAINMNTEQPKGKISKYIIQNKKIYLTCFNL